MLALLRCGQEKETDDEKEEKEVKKKKHKKKEKPVSFKRTFCVFHV